MSEFSRQEAENLFRQLTELAEAAGRAILAVYNDPADTRVQQKADDSPVTQADLAAHRILVQGLTGLLADTPVLSEESTIPDYTERGGWERYWLIDPLDGTKEFLNRNGEFTVNIALIHAGVPVMGLVYVPVKDWLYYGANGHGSYTRKQGTVSEIRTRTVDSALAAGRVAIDITRIDVLHVGVGEAGVLQRLADRLRGHFRIRQVVSGFLERGHADTGDENGF